MESNKDLLLCENKFFVEENKFENCLNFSKKDNKLTKTKDNVLKTEKLTSNVLSQVKSFMNLIKKADTKAVNIEDDDDNDHDDASDAAQTDTQTSSIGGDDAPDTVIIGSKQQKVQLDVLLFERGDQNSDDEDSDDSSDCESTLSSDDAQA